jgi:hypothetical protein
LQGLALDLGSMIADQADNVTIQKATLDTTLQTAINAYSKSFLSKRGFTYKA